MEAEVEEERQRKEREATKKKHEMTLGETKEQIQLLERKLEDLKKQKDEIFIQFKEVVNKENVLKRQSEREVPQEVFPVVSKQPQSHNIQPVFLPPRVTMYQPMPPSGNVVSHIGGLSHLSASVKRKQSPSPQSNIAHQQPPPPQISYGHRGGPPPPDQSMLGPPRVEDVHRRTVDGRAVLWTSKPTLLRHEPLNPAAAAFVADQLQYRPGAMSGYPPPPHSNSSVVSGKGPPPQQLYSFPIAIRPGGYHMDLIPPHSTAASVHHHQQLKPDVQIKPSGMPASIYHIDSRQQQSQMQKQQQQQQQSDGRHAVYHGGEVKQQSHGDDRGGPEMRQQSHYELAAANIRRDQQIHMYPNPNQLLQLSQQAQVSPLKKSLIRTHQSRVPLTDFSAGCQDWKHNAGLSDTIAQFKSTSAPPASPLYSSLLELEILAL